MSGTAFAILRMVETVMADEQRFGVFSTGEKLAIALVLDRKDLLDEVNGGYTMLDAIERLGPDWTAASLAVHRGLSITPDKTDAKMRAAFAEIERLCGCPKPNPEHIKKIAARMRGRS